MEANYELLMTAHGGPTFQENMWAHSLTSFRDFNYVAEPTPFMRKVLERVFGPLDYDIPYV